MVELMTEDRIDDSCIDYIRTMSGTLIQVYLFDFMSLYISFLSGN